MRADRARRGQVSAAQTVFLMIFGRTDLRIGVSGAKFDAEVDFDVRFASTPPKLDKNLEKNYDFDRFVSKFSKIAEIFRRRPNASERIWVHPNASEQVQTGPNRSEQVQPEEPRTRRGI